MMRYTLSVICLGLMADAALAIPQDFTRVNLSRRDDIAIVEDDGNPGDDVFQIRSLNGSFRTRTFVLPTGDLQINMGRGSDLLLFNGSVFPQIGGNIILNGGQGNDFAFVFNVDTVGNITSNDRRGDNCLVVSGSTIGGNLAVFDGAGEQCLGIFGTNIAGEVNIESTDGASLFSAVNMDVGRSVFLNNLNFGDDEIFFLNSSTGEQLFASLGNGVTSFTAADSSFGDSLSVVVESGTLNLNTDDVDVAGSLFAIVAEGETSKEIRNTNIGDLLCFDSFLGFDTALLENVQSREVKINNGEGGSLTEVMGEFDIERFVTRAGVGGDEVEFNGMGLVESVDVEIGDGNGRFESFGDITFGNLVYNSGDGIDIFTLSDTTVTGNAIVFLFDGFVEETINNIFFERSTIGGMLDLQSDAGFDVIRMFDSVFDGPVNMITGNDLDTIFDSNNDFGDSFVLDAGEDLDLYQSSGDSTFVVDQVFISVELFIPFERL